jgi:class 3 adenylate cyclase
MPVCGNCHQLNGPDARYCSACGNRLDPNADRPRERKVVTVLFADLVGFTSRAERMDVEDVHAMLHPYHTLVREQLEQRRGTVEKFIGDAVMAVFGAPTAHEDDPERAVRAALAIRDALALANERQPELDLHVRIGVNTGEALVSLDAQPAAGEGIASGDVVNTAARLQAAAPIDGVLVAEDTYRATRKAIDFGEAPPVHARGKAVPVPCWLALGPRSRFGETRRRQDATPLVGRRRERQAVIEAFERAYRNRSPQTLTLVGVPGIGKSRLVRELFRDLDRRHELIRWREGRSPPYGEGVTFWAFSEIVKAEAGLLESHEPDKASEKLAAAVAAVVDDREEAEWMERHLRPLVGLEAGEPLFGDRRAEAFAAWRRFIERLAERRPTVLVFEDVHWADDALLDFIEHLVAWAAGVQLLVVCTARLELLERRPAWRADSKSSRLLSLAPLSESETQELLEALLASALLRAETRTALVKGSAGNPLYAQELVRMLVDRAILSRHGDEWFLEKTEDFPVPDSVFGIISARLDALPAEDKAVIQDASVVGKVFWPGAVAYVAERGRWAIEEALRRLEERQLIRRRRDSSVAGDSEYAFEHALIREAAYRTILRPERAEEHRRAAEWLSSLAGGRSHRAEAIAHHYANAVENAEASGHASAELRLDASGALEAAAERAGSLHSHAGAARLWKHALDLCDEDDERRPRLLLSYGKALALADEPAEEVLHDAAVALVGVGDLSGAAEAESTRGWLFSYAGDQERARERHGRALELVHGTSPSQTKALILTGAGAHTLFVPERRAEALRLLEEALSIAVRVGLREIEAEARQFVGLARLDGADGRGVEDIEKALATSIELKSPVSLSCYGNLAAVGRCVGNLEAAATLRLEGERAAERFGIPVQVRRFRGEQACDLYHSGDWDDVSSQVEEYLDAIQTGSPHTGEAEVRIYRGRIRLARGDGPGALDDGEAALEFARRTAEPFDLLPALAFHARASSERALEQAEASAAQLLSELAASQPFWSAWSLPDVLEVLAGDGQRAELRRLLAPAMPRSRWYDAAAAVIENDFARAAELYAAIGSRPDEALARLRAAGKALATGNRVEADGQLTRAHAFFGRVGAEAHMRDARTLASA